MRPRHRGFLAAAALMLGLAAAPARAGEDGKPAAAAKEKSTSDLVREGLAHHDAGRYPDAIASYERALEIDPADAAARYELAFSYHANKDYARCLETTREGLRNPGPHEARFFSITGNCLDDSGRGAEAVATYRQGLAKHPHDARLHYNLAVSLWRQDAAEDAVGEAVATIGADPGYASAYMLVGAIENQRGRDVQALLAMLRYLMVDAESERSRQAGTLALDLFQRGITTQPGKGGDGKLQIDVAVSPRELAAGGLYGALALSRSMTAASIHSNEKESSPAGKLANALATYLAIASETAASPEHAASTREAQWRLIAAPLLVLHERDAATAFGYRVAERAGVPGAAEWVQENGEAMRRLAAVAETAAAAAP